MRTERVWWSIYNGVQTLIHLVFATTQDYYLRGSQCYIETDRVDS